MNKKFVNKITENKGKIAEPRNLNSYVTNSNVVEKIFNTVQCRSKN